MWKKTLIAPDTPIVKVIDVIDQAQLQIALVVDKNLRMLGTVTDGDIRRAILRDISLDEPVSQIMNPKPYYIFHDQPRQFAAAVMKNFKVRQVPVVDQNFCVVDLEIADELLTPPHRLNRVIIMAGGLGRRLHPLTESCPKPLLKIGGKPLLETILEGLAEQGFRHFYLSVNYKAEMIMDYFGNGSAWGVNINYLQESKRLGTVGALGLIKDRPYEPLLLVNGDVMTKVNYGQLLNFHRNNHADITICIKQLQSQIPYGVVTFDKNRLRQIEEKPVQQFFINAGIYVLNSNVMDYVTEDVRMDMPDLLRLLLNSQREIAVFPIREYWIDIGRLEEYEKANNEFAGVFE